jgi:hypothetical protein
MTSTELSQLTIKELKAIALENDIEVIGDKRLKATYILSIAQAHPLMAIETFQSEQTVIEIIEMPAIPDPFESQFELAVDLPLMEATEMASTAPIAESIVQPTPLAIPPTTHHRGAAIVMLTPLILLTVAVITIGTSISALIPLIAAVWRLLVAVWGSTICPQPVIPTIDRFPLPAVIPISA